MERPARYVVKETWDFVPVGKVVYLTGIDLDNIATISFMPCGRGPKRHLPITNLEAWPYDEFDSDDFN